VTHSPAEFLRDAREMASHASTYSSLDAETLAGTKDARFSVVYCLIVIGEALNNIPAPLQRLAPDIPWRSIIAMRNVDPCVLADGLYNCARSGTQRP
jgi:uncharacterized protein with HEPN domain